MSSKTVQKESWYADGLHFTCTQCGNCCTGPPGYVWFDSVEALAMAEYLKLDVDEFLRRYARPVDGRWSLEEHLNDDGQYDCVFLTRNEQGQAGCVVYSVRPTQCRTWPFWPENLRSLRSWKRASATCPGMCNGAEGVGSFYTSRKIRSISDSNPSK